MPPRDCLATARRISSALTQSARSSSSPLYFLDLNAISPLTAQKWTAEFAHLRDKVQLLDGGIIGGPPHPQSANSPPPATTTSSNPLPSGEPARSSSSDPVRNWYRPSVVTSGPNPLHDAPVSGAHLSAVLNARHIHTDLGPASGLKMCFASINKGFVAIATQAMSTAAQLGVLPELQSHLKEYTPAIGGVAERGVPNMCPKAYRWVAEMEEIAETMRVFGGWKTRGSDEHGAGRETGSEGEAGHAEIGDLFGAASDIYKFIADQSVLGKERVGARENGTTAEDVAKTLAGELSPEKQTTH